VARSYLTASELRPSSLDTHTAYSIFCIVKIYIGVLVLDDRALDTELTSVKRGLDRSIVHRDPREYITFRHHFLLLAVNYYA